MSVWVSSSLCSVIVTIFTIGDSDGKEFACSAGDLGSIPGSGRSCGKEWQPTPLFLPGEFHGQRSLESCNPWGCKELDTTE